MKSLTSTLKRVLTLGSRKRYSYRHIQTLLDIEGYKRPALSWIHKVLGVRKKEYIKIAGK